MEDNAGPSGRIIGRSGSSAVWVAHPLEVDTGESRAVCSDVVAKAAAALWAAAPLTSTEDGLPDSGDHQYTPISVDKNLYSRREGHPEYAFSIEEVLRTADNTSAERGQPLFHNRQSMDSKLLVPYCRLVIAGTHCPECGSEYVFTRRTQLKDLVSALRRGERVLCSVCFFKAVSPSGGPKKRERAVMEAEVSERARSEVAAAVAGEAPDTGEFESRTGETGVDPRGSTLQTGDDTQDEASASAARESRPRATPFTGGLEEAQRAWNESLSKLRSESGMEAIAAVVYAEVTLTGVRAPGDAPGVVVEGAIEAELPDVYTAALRTAEVREAMETLLSGELGVPAHLEVRLDVDHGLAYDSTARSEQAPEREYPAALSTGEAEGREFGKRDSGAPVVEYPSHAAARADLPGALDRRLETIAARSIKGVPRRVFNLSLREKVLLYAVLEHSAEYCSGPDLEYLGPLRAGDAPFAPTLDMTARVVNELRGSGILTLSPLSESALVYPEPSTEPSSSQQHAGIHSAPAGLGALPLLEPDVPVVSLPSVILRPGAVMTYEDNGWLRMGRTASRASEGGAEISRVEEGAALGRDFLREASSLRSRALRAELEREIGRYHFSTELEPEARRLWLDLATEECVAFTLWCAEHYGRPIAIDEKYLDVLSYALELYSAARVCWLIRRAFWSAVFEEKSPAKSHYHLGPGATPGEVSREIGSSVRHLARRSYEGRYEEGRLERPLWQHKRVRRGGQLKVGQRWVSNDYLTRSTLTRVFNDHLLGLGDDGSFEHLLDAPTTNKRAGLKGKL